MDDSGVEDSMTEELYISNVSALRESLEKQSGGQPRSGDSGYSAVSYVKLFKRKLVL